MYVRSAQWSPDGRYVYFTSDRGGGPQVYRVPADGGAPPDDAGSLPDGAMAVDARAVVLRQRPFADRGRGLVAVVCAGTSDLPVAREAALTAELLDEGTTGRSALEIAREGL